MAILPCLGVLAGQARVAEIDGDWNGREMTNMGQILADAICEAGGAIQTSSAAAFTRACGFARRGLCSSAIQTSLAMPPLRRGPLSYIHPHRPRTVTSKGHLAFLGGRR